MENNYGNSWSNLHLHYACRLDVTWKLVQRTVRPKSKENNAFKTNGNPTIIFMQESDNTKHMLYYELSYIIEKRCRKNNERYQQNSNATDTQILQR